RLQGMISLAAISEYLLHVPGAAVEQLSRYTVADAMLPVNRWVNDPSKLETILNYLVDEPFIPLVDEQKVFQGIITRPALLKRIKFYTRNLRINYDVTANESVAD